MHNGIDFSAPGGANILAVADGQVSFAGDMGGCGNAVEITHSGGYLSKYCHALKVLVQKGQSVKSGLRLPWLAQREHLPETICT